MSTAHKSQRRLTKRERARADKVTRFANRFRQAQTVVRRSGIAAELEARLRAGHGGRPRALSVEVLFAACIAVFDVTHKNATLVSIHRLLTSLPPSERIRLRISWTTGDELESITVRQVRYLFAAVTSMLDYSPHTATVGRHADARDLTQDERIDRENQAIDYLTRLLHASTGPLPHPNVLALDASGIRSNSRRRKQVKAAKHDDYRLDSSAFVKHSTQSHDKDARSGYNTPTEAKYDSSSLWGYQLVNTCASYDKASPYRYLQPIVAMTLVPANALQEDPALRVPDSITTHFTKPEMLLDDRGFSKAAPDRWAEPLRERGIAQTIDLMENQRGEYIDPLTGVLMIDGWPHVPWTPQHLRKIARPSRWVARRPGDNASKKKWDEYTRLTAELQTFRALNDELGRYALRPNGKARPDGSRQYKVPTHQREKATAAQRRKAVFTQATIVIPGSVLPALRQPLRWGSTEWITQWSRRGAVESGYSNLKSFDTENFNRGAIRVVGLIRVGLMLAFAAVHYNLRILTKWAALNGRTDEDPELLTPDDIVGYEPVTLDDVRRRGSPATAA